MKKFFNKKGFTLIEVILSIAIMAIVIQVGYSLFFTGNKSFEIGIDKGFAQQDARIVAEHLNRELRFSSKLSEDSLTGRYFSIEVLDNGYDSNSLKKIEYDGETIKSEEILISGKWDKVKLKNSSRIIEGLISIKTNQNTNYNLPINIPLENIKNSLDLDIDLSNGEKIYYALAEDNYVANNPSDGGTPPSTEEPEEPGEGDDPGDQGESEDKVYPTWVVGVSYDINKIVTYNNKLYIKKTSWGDDVVPGNNFKVWNEYSDSKAWLGYNVYLPGDEVLHEGIRYRAKWEHSGSNPKDSGPYDVWEKIKQ